MDDTAVDEDYGIEHKEIKEKILGSLVTAGKKEMDLFLNEGDQINVFAYGGKDKIAEHLDSQVPHKPVMTKASQYVDVIGAYLMEQNPTRRAEPREWAPPVALNRAQWMEKYLNYIPRQTDLKTHSRRAVIQACIYGKGVLWVGWNKEKGLTDAIFDTVQNLLVDPDARYREECNWKARKRQKPRWWLLKYFPEAKDCINQLTPDGKKRSSSGADFTTDTITFYEMYFRIGLHNYEGGKELLEQEPGEETAVGDDSPVKYIYAAGGKLLAEQDWEVPLFKKDLWPCVELDFRENPGHYWPKSPIWPGLSQLKNMNWLYRHMMARVRQSARAFLILLNKSGVTIGTEDLDKLLGQASTPDAIWDLLTVNANGSMEGAKINEIIQQLKLESNIDEFLKAIAFESQEFEKATGLYGILYQGQSDTQIRSAAEVNFRDKTSRSRIDDLLASVEAWSDQVAATQAMYARFLSIPEEDILPIFGPEGVQGFGFVIPELQDETLRIASDYMAQGAPPQIAQKLASMEAQQAQMEMEAQGGVTFSTWLREADYSICGGSTRRKDVDEEKEVYASADAQLIPALMKSGLPALMGIGMKITYERFKLIGAPQTLLNDINTAIQIITAPPPPPMPGAPGQAPPQGGPPPTAGGPQPGSSQPPPGVQ